MKLTLGLLARTASAPSKNDKGRLEAMIQNKEAIKVKLDTKENAKTKLKRQNAFIWVAENFPISFQSIYKALNFLAKGNRILGKLQDVLNSEVNPHIFQ